MTLSISNLRNRDWNLTPTYQIPNMFPRGAVAQLAERRVRNAEARSSTLLCSTKYFQPLTAAGTGGCFGEVANM